MKPITSSDNQIYKTAAQLRQKKYRDEQMSFLIEGPNLIREAIKCGVQIEMLICSEDYEPQDMDAPMTVMSTALFRKLSDTENPQGIMAIIKKRIYSETEFFKERTNGASNVILFDRLQDPGNIGTILRTADAAGYMGAILMKGTADIYSPKIVRATAGSIFRMPVLFLDNPEQAIRLLKNHRKKIICTSPNGNNVYNTIDMKENIAIIIGNEGNGACEEFLEQADLQIKIPMEGSVESLNAAVSAGILMYESVRQSLQINN